MTSLTDQANATTQFQYDKRSLPTQRTDPLGHISSSVYDDAGKIVSHTDRNGDAVTRSYTASGKLKQIGYPGNSTVSFDYDNRDRLTTMTDPTGNTSNSYDAAGRLTGTTDPNGFNVQYQYDAAGNLTQLTYPGGNTVSYSYDALNRLESVHIDWLNKTLTYHYDAAGRLIQTDQFNGSQTSYGYDDADRLTSLNHTTGSQTLAGYTYTLDGNGNRTHASVVEPKLPEQLINQAHSYSYQTATNRIVNAQSGSGSIAYSYDNAGQLQSNGSTSFSFDYAHRLIHQDNSNYLYDGVGNRIQATRSGNITKYVVDAAGNLLAEANASNQITHYYVYGLGLLARVDPQPNALYVYHFDGTGHTVAITNDTRQVINTYAYDPYGKLMAEQAMISQPFKYAGQFGVQAEGNNLYYMRARYYDAEVGKFISEDPIGFEGGLNLYAYVGGNPIMAVDPWGLCPACALAGARIAEFGIQAYSKLRPAIKGMELEAHHLIEKRFAETLGVKGSEMLSVALPKAEHQAITNAWRSEIGYGAGTRSATAETVMAAATKIYESSPAILSALGLAGAAGSANAASGGYTSSTGGK